jgi:hypothetical protein
VHLVGCTMGNGKDLWWMWQIYGGCGRFRRLALWSCPCVISGPRHGVKWDIRFSATLRSVRSQKSDNLKFCLCLVTRHVGVWGSVGMVPCINLDTIWGGAVGFTPRTLTPPPPKKNPCNPRTKRLGGPQNRSVHCGNMPYPYRGREKLPILGRPSGRMVIAWTQLPFITRTPAPTARRRNTVRWNLEIYTTTVTGFSFFSTTKWNVTHLKSLFTVRFRSDVTQKQEYVAPLPTGQTVHFL